MSTESAPSRPYSGASSADDKQGYRAAEAFVRPHPIATHGDLVSYAFDLKKGEFQLHLSAPDATREDAPTEIFLPEFHFPRDQTDVQVSGGKWSLEAAEAAVTEKQTLRWWHAGGEQSVKITGVVQRLRATAEGDDAASWLDQCKEKGCIVM